MYVYTYMIIISNSDIAMSQENISRILWQAHKTRLMTIKVYVASWNVKLWDRHGLRFS